jgi:hypothetical protein
MTTHHGLPSAQVTYDFTVVARGLRISFTTGSRMFSMYRSPGIVVVYTEVVGKMHCHGQIWMMSYAVKIPKSQASETKHDTYMEMMISEK